MSQAATLDAFARALRREAHVLGERPDLTWQQLYNRLQWEGGPFRHPGHLEGLRDLGTMILHRIELEGVGRCATPYDVAERWRRAAL